MRLSTAVIAILFALLVASNAWWAYHAIDAGVTATYQQESFRSTQEALAQALAVLPVAASPTATKEQVILAARRGPGGPASYDTFEKDGFTWVGQLGLRFDDAGRLVEASPSWSP